MGVLDIPTQRMIIREAVTYEVAHIDDYHSDDQDHHQQLPVNERPRKQRTPKLGRRVYGTHDMQRKNGVRRQRRNDNLMFLYSLIDGVNPEELQDDDKFNMTTFGELFADPNKMRAWAEFMVLAEEDQLLFLERAQQSKKDNNNANHGCPIEGGQDDAIEQDQNFSKISKNIRDFLCSENLAKESLMEFEEDLIISFKECPFDVLLLDVPSSFDRMMIHGLCQYMQLQASTHKFKKKRLMEIETEVSPFAPPSRLLSQYLETVNK